MKLSKVEGQGMLILDQAEMEYQLGSLEALLFAVGDEGVSLEQMEYAMDVEEERLILLLETLAERYKKPGSGFEFTQVNQQYKLITKKDYAPCLRRLVQNPNQRGLSSAALEVLAVIAYKQPITRHEIEHIRGTNSENVLRRLLTFGLIEEAGRLEAPGRPLLFKTAEGFLDHFGITTIEELPDLPFVDESCLNKEKETELFTSNRTEEQQQAENLKTIM